MGYVVVDSEESASRLLAEDRIEVRTPDGRVVGSVRGFLTKDLERQIEASKNDPRPPVPADVVRERLGLPPFKPRSGG